MEFFHTIRLQVLIILICTSANGQIESGKTKSTPKKNSEKIESQEKIAILYQPTSEFYFGGSIGMADRMLTENSGLFGKPLGERANENPLITGGFTVGLRNKIKKNFWLDFGASLARNGESYDYKSEINDSSYSYKTNYNYFAIPIKLQYITAGKFKFVAGLGLQPQLFMGFKQKNEWIDSENVNGNSTITDNKQINFFTISALANIGFSWQIKPKVSFYFLPEVRTQLNSTYQKQAPYIHKGMFLGIQTGFSFGIN